MRKVDYINLANILNQDIRHSMEYHDWHLMKALNSENKADTAMHSENVRYYEKRKAHTIDLTRTIARNISVDKKEFLKSCGIENR